MKNSTCTLARLYIEASSKGAMNRSPRPLRKDRLGRDIFEDGSWVDHNAAGEPIFGSYDPAEWLQLETEAWLLGRHHRISRKRIHGAFKSATRRYPTRICKSYIEGFFSVPEWPKKTPE